MQKPRTGMTLSKESAAFEQMGQRTAVAKQIENNFFIIRTQIESEPSATQLKHGTTFTYLKCVKTAQFVTGLFHFSYFGIRRAFAFFLFTYPLHGTRMKSWQRNR
jgi:hypothetical protein